MDTKIREASEYLNSLHPREEGMHVSDLVQCRRKSWYIRNSSFKAAPHSTNTLLMFLLGQGHHAILQKDRDERKAIMEFDGTPVTGSIDDWVHDDPAYPTGYPEEYKTTRGSLAKSPYPAMHYIEQGASYCVMTGTSKLRVSAFYLFGDWRAAKFPQGRSSDITFSDQEMVDWHREMGRRVRLILGDTPPGFEEKRDWECDYCPFNKARGGPCDAVKMGKNARPDFFEIEPNVQGFLEEE